MDYTFLREVRRGGFSWEMCNTEDWSNPQPLRAPVTLHIPDRKPPIHWRLDRYLPIALLFSTGGLLFNIMA